MVNLPEFGSFIYYMYIMSKTVGFHKDNKNADPNEHSPLDEVSSMPRVKILMMSI